MPEQIGNALVHPLRRRLLLEYAHGPDCPSQVAGRLGAALNVVAYHTNVLLRHGHVELVRSERRGGSLTRFYRSTASPVVTASDWERLPASLRSALALSAVERAAERARRAVLDGGFDHVGAHLSRVPLELDAEGMLAVERCLDGADRAIARIAARSRRRAGARPYEVVLLAFTG